MGFVEDNIDVRYRGAILLHSLGDILTLLSNAFSMHPILFRIDVLFLPEAPRDATNRIIIVVATVIDGRIRPKFEEGLC